MGMFMAQFLITTQISKVAGRPGLRFVLALFILLFFFIGVQVILMRKDDCYHRLAIVVNSVSTLMLTCAVLRAWQMVRRREEDRDHQNEDQNHVEMGVRSRFRRRIVVAPVPPTSFLQAFSVLV